MLFIIVAMLVIAVIWYRSKLKKRRATRALIYLAQMLNEDFNADKIIETNALVSSFDKITIDEMEREVRPSLYFFYRGNRSAAIVHAMNEGFRG